MGDYLGMYNDSLQAIEMDDQYAKAFIANGEALIMIGKGSWNCDKIDKGIHRLERAINLHYKQKTMDLIASV